MFFIDQKRLFLCSDSGAAITLFQVSTRERSISIARDFRRSDPVHECWPTPPSRDYKGLSDINLYAEVLQIAATGPVSVSKLMSEEEGLRQRLRKLVLIQNPTKTNVGALLSTLEAFRWLESHAHRERFLITEEGQQARELSEKDRRGFRRLLASKLHERFAIPGWFIHRLHALNPKRQGEIVLPAPGPLDRSKRRTWAKNEWLPELDAIVISAAEQAEALLPGSFPIDSLVWLEEVRATWRRLGQGNPPTARKAGGDINHLADVTFGVRERLFHAMRETAVNLLFGPHGPGMSRADFLDDRLPLPPRSFTVWCPRLSELEFIFYTDYHPQIVGRVIVPCGAFRNRVVQPFESISAIRDPQNRTLCLYQPDWDYIKDQFTETVLSSYRVLCKRVGSLYVSLLDLRDEVCRQLRLSALLFESLLESAYRVSVREGTHSAKNISIALESDIRPEQRSAIGLNRRPVYISRVPHSLIAIATNAKSHVWEASYSENLV